jgi:hypothetical protein
MGQDRSGATTRPRYGRITAAGVSASITFLSVLGAVGVLPSGPSAAAPAPDPGTSQPPPPGTGTSRAASGETAGRPAVPAHSGTGRRVVFDMSDQRVWLVGREAGRDAVRRTYLVSGSVTDNLGPGSYEVYSKSRHAVGVDDSGTMGYMVRFTRGQRAAIGFHDIPVDDGRLVQTRDQLGTPRSHGCIRQWRPDAKALWDFAPVGTPVVVVA